MSILPFRTVKKQIISVEYTKPLATQKLVNVYYVLLVEESLDVMFPNTNIAPLSYDSNTWIQQ